MFRESLRAHLPRRSGAPGTTPRGVALRLGTVLLLPMATLAIALVEGPPLGIPDASPLYLVAVVGIAVALGTFAAIAAALASFLLYDALFVEPRLTLHVNDPAEWLNLLLLLFVGIVIGRLAALQAERADDATRRAGESRALFRISRTLATATDVSEALPVVIDDLLAETRMDRIWLGRQEAGREGVIADSGDGLRPSHRIHVVLTRTPGDLPARWVQEHRPQDRPGDTQADPGVGLYRTTISAGDATVGSIWATRRRTEGVPDREETRLLSLAADQIGLAFRPRAPGRDGECRGSRPPGRGVEGRPARFGLPRIPHAAGQHPRRRRKPARPRGGVVRRTTARCRPHDRFGSGTPQRPGPQPPRHESHRGGRAPPEP